MTINDKYNNLISYLKTLDSVAVAFSGGVDSTLLLKASKEALGPDSVIAVTVISNLIPQFELKDSADFCASEGINQMLCRVDELAIDGFSSNPPNRCYICKKAIFSNIIDIAKSNGIANILEGSNLDDDNDYRPGMQAIKELGILSPLKQCELTKDDIRAISKSLNLPTWDKPSFACLASRFTYGEEITVEKLKMVESAEDILRNKGFKQLRVRIHSHLARIEVLPADLERLFSIKDEINAEFKKLGFKYVTMDLGGFRSGSMNDVL